MNARADFTGDTARTPREKRASVAAGRQGLCLRRSCTRPDPHDPSRYDLVSERYNRPIATGLELIAIEGWLGIRGKARRQ